jgi:hypothetical protein
MWFTICGVNTLSMIRGLVVHLRAASEDRANLWFAIGCLLVLCPSVRFAWTLQRHIHRKLDRWERRRAN